MERCGAALRLALPTLVSDIFSYGALEEGDEQLELDANRTIFDLIERELRHAIDGGALLAENLPSIVKSWLAETPIETHVYKPTLVANLNFEYRRLPHNLGETLVEALGALKKFVVIFICKCATVISRFHLLESILCLSALHYERCTSVFFAHSTVNTRMTLVFKTRRFYVPFGVYTTLRAAANLRAQLDPANDDDEAKSIDVCELFFCVARMRNFLIIFCLQVSLAISILKCQIRETLRKSSSRLNALWDANGHIRGDGDLLLLSKVSRGK